jgi:hypothetical protein
MLGISPLSTYPISDELLNHGATVALDTADASSTSDTTPTLLFTGTDTDGDNLTYEVQIDTVNTFDSNPGSGTATVVQSKAANAGGYVTTPTIQFNSNTTTGNTIIIAVTYNDDVTGNPTSITDTTSNTYAKIAGGASGGDTTTELWYAYNITGGTTPTLTVNMSNANSHDFSMTLREVSGLTTTDPFDVKAEGATASGTTHTSPSTTTTSQADEFVYACMGLAANATFTAGAGYSNLAQVNGSDIFQASASESKSVSSTGTQSASFTTSATTVGYVIVATFKIAVVPGTPLIDALSDTDAGFTDVTNGADTDPFASGDQVSYTVQSALTPSTTYYWRVRAKDPSGTNAYGAWATTRSFDITSGGSVLTKTQGAVARIAINSTKTQPAVSRISVNITKTQPAVSRIANIFTKTQSAIARIAKTITKTQPAVARIAAILTKTQSATARIAQTITKTQPATARIGQTGTKTQPSTSRISVTTLKTQSATARIARILTKTQPAVARIVAVLTKTQGAVARIANLFGKTQSAIARIANTRSSTQPATARIAVIRTLTQSATARIARILTKTQPAVARIAIVRTLTQSAVANIVQSGALTKTQTATARIIALVTKTQSAIARIATNLTKTQPATARIANNRSLTQSAVARIAKVLTKTQPALARIAVLFTKTQPATSRIANTLNTDTIPGNSLSFNGTTNAVQATINSPASNTTTVSMAVWFKVTADSTNTAIAQPIFAYRFWRLHIRNSNNQVNWRFDETVAHLPSPIGTATLGTGNRGWHLAVGVYRYTGGTNSTQLIYVDGVLANTLNNTALPTSAYTASNILLGSFGGAFLSGNVKRAIILHREMTAKEVTDLYTNNQIPDDAYARYEVNEGAGTTINDSAAVPNPAGSITGGAVWDSGASGLHRLYGRARIALALQKTQPAQARLAVSMSKTQPATARIAGNVNQPNPSVLLESLDGGIYPSSNESVNFPHTVSSGLYINANDNNTVILEDRI